MRIDPAGLLAVIFGNPTSIPAPLPRVLDGSESLNNTDYSCFRKSIIAC
jgi:hypothetical protein